MKNLRLAKYFIAAYLLLCGLSAHATENIESEWTKVKDVSISFDSVVTLVLEADISAGCDGEITFTYADNTLSKHYYTLLVSARVSNLPVKVTYRDDLVACTISEISLKPPVASE